MQPFLEFPDRKCTNQTISKSLFERGEPVIEIVNVPFAAFLEALISKIFRDRRLDRAGRLLMMRACKNPPHP